MSKVHSMQESLDRSKAYEEQIINYFQDKANAQGVSFLDSRDIESYRAKDVDFVIDGVEMEIKCDFQGHKTGNLSYEHISSKIGNTVVGKGCFAKTTAKNIYYYLIHTGLVYELNVEELRKEVGMQFVLGNFVTRAIKNNWGGKVMEGEVILVPFESLSSKVITDTFKVDIIEFKEENGALDGLEDFGNILAKVDLDALPF